VGTVAIRAEGLGKQYLVQRVRDDHPTARAALTTSVARLFRGGRDARDTRQFWALKDVSFEIHAGEVVGIIGNNGAGKSTLLKILSRITAPTTGRVDVRGRLGSLLEVGTGFHPELSGRENVYLNGAILGMRKAEIDRKFDEIVAFSEVEDFLDTPVKHYSSGMQVRLAFAVAAHLEPEILVIDEVLAVGDAAFQKKCLGKIGTVSRDGRTVVFVSHNLGAVRALCDRGILLRHGMIATDQPAGQAIATYLQTLETAASSEVRDRVDRHGKGDVRVARIEIAGDHGERILTTGRSARFTFHVTAMRPGTTCSFTIYDALGQPVTYFDSAGHDAVPLDDGDAFTCALDALLLVPGRYRINVALASNDELQDHLEGAAFIEVDHGVLQGRAVPDDAGHGSAVMPHRWTRPA
jgi:lipopolysaccharide transport system ATP-binding protein